jgi:hypothetical protein
MSHLSDQWRDQDLDVGGREPRGGTMLKNVVRHDERRSMSLIEGLGSSSQWGPGPKPLVRGYMWLCSPEIDNKFTASI